MNLKDAADITRPLNVRKPDPLKCYDYSDIGLGFVLHCWYSHEWDEDNVIVTIERIELNTGNQTIPLRLHDVPGTDLLAIEALIAEQEYADAYEAAKSLAESREDDRGDWLYEARKDREALK